MRRRLLENPVQFCFSFCPRAPAKCYSCHVRIFAELTSNVRQKLMDALFIVVQEPASFRIILIIIIPMLQFVIVVF